MILRALAAGIRGFVTGFCNALGEHFVRTIGWVRMPDFIVGGADRPYLNRWFLIPRNRWFNVYLHQFLRDDDDRALHDHPWVNLSILLIGEYKEQTIRAGGIHVRSHRKAGAFKLRWPRASHRIELVDGRPCWTLFITGPKVRSWGFHCRQGWVDWTKFTDPNDTGRVGPGCGDKA
ncbi:MAG TPA: hypothetical protein VGO34_14805 [Alphaproteobacteria bacterium]|jgi:hypothetical protein